jgi:hypothetical protein
VWGKTIRNSLDPIFCYPVHGAQPTSLKCCARLSLIAMNTLVKRIEMCCVSRLSILVIGSAIKSANDDDFSRNCMAVSK